MAPQPSPSLIALLGEAVEELRSDKNENALSSRFHGVGEVADHIEKLTGRFLSGDSAAARELYLTFCATGDWDDASGSHELGNQLLLALEPYYASLVT